MKKYIYIAIASLILILYLTTVIQNYRIKSYKNDLTQATATIAAYAAENSSIKKSNEMFMISIDDLKYSKDSLIQKMNEARKSLKIKDKEIQRLGYLLSTANKKDTIHFRDTLFKDADLKIDTTITDKDGWYRCCVGLEYPDKVMVEPTFKSEKYVITSLKKETVAPPKKCWIGRLFQKKRDVMTIDVVENNPFITNNKERFITVIN